MAGTVYCVTVWRVLDYHHWPVSLKRKLPGRMPQMSPPLSPGELYSADVLLLGSRGAGMTAVGEILEDLGSHVLRMDAAAADGGPDELPYSPASITRPLSFCVY